MEAAQNRRYAPIRVFLEVNLDTSNLGEVRRNGQRPRTYPSAADQPMLPI
jgi:hypothetical protein